MSAPAIIRGISSMATRAVLAELAPAYTEQSGQRIEIEFAGGVDALRRVRAGESFDFIVLAGDVIAQLGDSGLVDVSSRRDVAASRVAVAVAAGAPLPGIASEEAMRNAISRARTIGYSTGPSGTHLMSLLQRWGLRESLAPRLVQAPPGTPVGALVARGEAELGIQQYSELFSLAGIQVVGMLPPEIQAVTVFAAAVGSTSMQPAPTRQFLAYLASPPTAAAKQRHGMEVPAQANAA